MDEERTLRASAAPSRPSGKSVVAAGLGVFAVCGVAATRVGFGPAAGGLSGLFATTATTPAASYDAAPSSELSFYVWSDYVDEYGDVGTDYSWFSDGGYSYQQPRRGSKAASSRHQARRLRSFPTRFFCMVSPRPA